MSIYLTTNTGRLWVGDHDPSSSESTSGGVIQKYDFYINKISNVLFQNVDSTIDSLQWAKQSPSPSMLNVTRNYSLVNLSLDTVRLPNNNFDTFVSLAVNLINNDTDNSALYIQLNSGDGFIILALLENDSSLISNITMSYSFIVPKGTTYKLVPTGSGEVKLIRLYELTL